ncbi:GMC family oxidoreductase [Pseudonocardia alni]|uniref:GMC family oxidoreductase n=1 Tax=Pseudonocardia alni TaxID=33907 RepID=UPI0033187801
MTRRIVVCGAGSAGCVVAARLSEDVDTEVVLLEAGPELPPAGATPTVIRELGVRVDGYDWGYTAEPDAVVAPWVTSALGVTPPDPHPVRRGKVVGGSGSVNASNALRPQPRDFHRWGELGATDWTWETALPYLVAMERDDAPGDFHGRSGPLRMSRYRDEELLNYNAAFLRSCADLGHPVSTDLNAPDASGAGVVPKNRDGDTRWSSAMGYLPQARLRPNFRLRPDATVDRVLLDGGRAAGVVLDSGEQIDADVVVLATGALGSPAVLQRSGIGPRQLLESLGIPVVLNAPAVGRNLSDHPMYYMGYSVTPQASTILSVGQVVLVSGLSGTGSPAAGADINIVPLKLGEMLTVAVGLTTPHSRGHVAIRSADPAAPPRVALNFFDSPQDLPRLVEGVTIARRVLAGAAMAPFIAGEVLPGPADGGDEVALARSVVRGLAGSYYHPVGTCRMGPAGPWSVVDRAGAVHEIDGLHVIDASIMPAIPSQPTNMMTMLLAERCVDVLRRGLRVHEGALSGDALSQS